MAWRNESRRHSLARKGIKTANKLPKNMAMGLKGRAKYQQEAEKQGLTGADLINYVEARADGKNSDMALLEVRENNQDPYNFQDNNQELIIHSSWNDRSLNFRFTMEGAGDIFRELTKRDPDPAYIYEKTQRIEKYFKNKRDRQSYAMAYIKDKDKIDKMLDLWKKQPYETELQKKAIDLNIAMLKGDNKKAGDLLNSIDKSV